MSLKASYAQMNQVIHLLTNSGIGLPTDLWVPATRIVPPQQSRQLAVGWAYNINDIYEVSVEGYYKNGNIIEYAGNPHQHDLTGKTAWSPAREKRR
jgi:hypothetical protein